MNLIFDVVIVGGGMAGSTLALALNNLSQGRLRIAIVEAFETHHPEHPGFDARSIALSYGTAQQLARFGLWQSMASIATPINHIQVSDRYHGAMVNMDSEALLIDALGYVVELSEVGRLYQQLLSHLPQIKYFCPQSVQKLVQTPEQIAVHLSNQQVLNARLVVAADGTFSSCCEQLGLTLESHDFNQTAIIANIRTSLPHQNRAFERFTEQGPLALLPMSEDRWSLVWCVSPEQATSLMKLTQEAFLEQLQYHFGWRLGRFIKTGERHSYPLLLRYRKQVIAHRFVTVGNAAQTLHPIAGQGFNLAMRDVAALAENIVNASEIGAYPSLAQYAQQRSQDRTDMMQLTSGLVRIFSTSNPGLALVRNLGLELMQSLPCLKAPLLRHTLGVTHKL